MSLIRKMPSPPQDPRRASLIRKISNRRISKGVAYSKGVQPAAGCSNVSLIRKMPSCRMLECAAYAYPQDSQPAVTYAGMGTDRYCNQMGIRSENII